MGLTTGGEATSSSSAYLDAFASFRDEIRGLARDRAEHRSLLIIPHSNPLHRALLTACDQVRDVTLVNLGVRLEDRPDGKAIWKLEDPSVLKAEMEEKKAMAQEQALKKLRAKLEQKMREKERFEKAFELPSKYSQYDAESDHPTHDKDGIPLEGKVLREMLLMPKGVP